jgi:hypothetical protein
MFVAFMLLHILFYDEMLLCIVILLYDEVLLYIVLCVEVVRSLNLKFESKWFQFIKDFKNRKLTLSGLRGKGLTQPNPT